MIPGVVPRSQIRGELVFLAKEFELVSRLEGKVAIVAGAGQTPGETMGNGRACALRFAEEGARAVCVDLREDSAGQTVAMILEAGGEALAVDGGQTARIG